MKRTAISLAVAAAAIACIVASVEWAQAPAPAPAHDGWTAYEDAAHGFSFSYPADFTLYSSMSPDERISYMTYMGICAESGSVYSQKVCYTGAPTDESLSGASFSVSVAAATSSESCLPISFREPIVERAVNGRTFKETRVSDAGLSHYVSSDSLAAYANGRCYEIDLSVETHATEDPDPRHAVDDMMRRLGSILDTLRIY